MDGDSTIWNPKTSRYVRRTGKVGVAVLAAAAEIERIKAAVYLDRNALNAIAERCDPETRRALAQVDREFAATVRVDPSEGRRNAAFLAAFLHENWASPGRLQMETKGGARMDVDVLGDGDSLNRRIVFRRHRAGELSDVVGMFRYATREDLTEGMRLGEVVKRQKHKFVSDLLGDLGCVYARHSAPLRAWRVALGMVS